MQTSNKNIINISSDIVPCDVYFCYGKKSYNNNMDYYREEGFKINDVSSDAVCTFLRDHKEGISKIYISIPKFKKGTDIYSYKSLAVHELSHAVSFIMEEFGFKCDEFRSYLLQKLYIDAMVYLDERISK